MIFFCNKFHNSQYKARASFYLPVSEKLFLSSSMISRSGMECVQMLIPQLDQEPREKEPSVIFFF